MNQEDELIFFLYNIKGYNKGDDKNEKSQEE